MAGEQDILSLGLNIDSFNAQKKKALTEFISIFDQLSKYDGKIFNPVMGDGLAQFNKSIQETSKSIDTINAKLSSLNSTLSKNSQAANNAATANKNNASSKSSSSASVVKNTKDIDDNTRSLGKQITEYDKLVKKVKELELAYKSSVLSTGKKSEQSIQLAEQFKSANLELTKVEKTFSKTANASGALGKMLSENLSGLRNIAYILPGIGLAGIFNLAFEAVTALVEGMIDLGGEESKQLDFVKKLNDAYLQLEETYLKVYRANEKLYSLNPGSLQSNENQADLFRSQGQNNVTVFQKDISNLKQRVSNIQSKVVGQYPDGIQGFIRDNIAIGEKLKDNAQEINRLNLLIAGSGSKKKLQPKADSLVSENALLDFDFKRNQEIIDEYFSSKKDLVNKEAEYQKFLADQQRKYIVETTRNDIAVRLDAAKKILANERSTEKERIDALKDIKNQEARLSRINEFDIVSNISTNPKERLIAQNKLSKDLVKQEADFLNEKDKVQTEFYQRYIKALTGLSKLEIEAEAVKQERIYKNDEKSLEERLTSYSKYISARQYIQDKEFERDIQKGANKKGGKTSLTKEEQDEIKGNRDNQKAIIQADVEKQVYDIVYSSLRKQLKAVLDANFLQEEENKKAYAKELNDLNKSFEDKLISYRRYKKERERIDKLYTRSGYDEAIEDDKKDIKRLEDLLEKEKQMLKKAESEKESSAINLDYVSKSGDGNVGDAQEGYDRSVGEVNSINDAIIEAEKELQKAKEKLDDDELKRAKLKYDQLIAYQKEYAANNKAIIDALYSFIKTAVDAEYERYIEKNQLKRDTFNESYQNEIDAVEKSSLSSKDKAALDIQLQTQKDEANKNSAKEERRLKHDQAVADRALNVAHVIWNTQEAVSAALTIPPPAGEILAAQRAILGGIQVATILAANIPSYEFGTKDHPGGYARYAEKGKPELLIEPGKEPYVALRETVSYLPAHTQVIPLVNNSPVFERNEKDDSWMQTRFLARQIAKSNKDVKNVIHNTVKIDLGFENYKRTILGN